MERGETPWDNMSADELRLEVWRLYKAAETAESCMAMQKAMCEHEGTRHPYWSNGGSGGSALLMLDQALHIRDGLDCEGKETLWHGFFRNAMPLLFNGLDHWEWMVCEGCQQWTTGNECRCGNDKLRPIEWDDFRAVQTDEQKEAK